MNVNGIRIAVKVSPGASRNSIIGFAGDVLHVKVAAPPVEGKANKELIAYLSKLLGVSKSSVVIEKGLSGRRKILSIYGLDQAQFEKILSKLLNL